MLKYDIALIISDSYPEIKAYKEGKTTLEEVSDRLWEIADTIIKLVKESEEL